MKIVVIIDSDSNEYHSHHLFETSSCAYAFADGIEAAWKISHGVSNWTPYALCNKFDFEEWERLGSPGKEEMAKGLKNDQA